MLSEKELLEKAEIYIKEIENESKIPLVLGYDITIKKDYGSIFFYTSKQFLETGDFKYAVAGNAPFLIEKKTGNIIEFGTSEPYEYYMSEYEAGRWPIK